MYDTSNSCRKICRSFHKTVYRSVLMCVHVYMRQRERMVERHFRPLNIPVLSFILSQSLCLCTPPSSISFLLIHCHPFFSLFFIYSLIYLLLFLVFYS